MKTKKGSFCFFNILFVDIGRLRLDWPCMVYSKAGQAAALQVLECSFFLTQVVVYSDVV